MLHSNLPFASVATIELSYWFMAEMSIMERERFYLRDAKVIAVQGEPRQIMLLFMPRDKDAQHLPTLKLYSVERESILMLKVLRSFDITIHSLSGEDINRDGKPELVVERWSGGNCLECITTEIFQINAGAMLTLFSTTHRAQIVDLLKDGVYEISAMSAALPSDLGSEFGQAFLPMDVRVYKWAGNGYVDRSTSFYQYYDLLIGEIKRDSVTNKDDRARFADAVNLLLRYYRSGRCTEGWHEYNMCISRIVEPTGVISRKLLADVSQFLVKQLRCPEK
jgi:hypothetical protein